MLLGDPTADVERIAELRDLLDRDGGEAFARRLEQGAARLDLAGLHEVARFVTPSGPPRRFDTRFFLTGAPAGQTPLHDDGEITDVRWIHPAEAIDAWRAGELTLMAVTHRMLACLARFDTAAEALACAAARPEAARLRVLDPDGEYQVLLPGEPGYEAAELEIEHGSIRLWRDHPAR